MKIHLIEWNNVPIFEQLKTEEALLRSSEENFCILNRGSPRAIVMGISGNPKSLLNLEKVKKEKIPIIKRFSGGGTVIVDESTLFVTFIFAKNLLNIPAFPESILRWSASLYQKSWQIPNFVLRENDYCIGDKKCGGNAQYIRKDRWLHHTSFLWDYSLENMDCLLLPEKRPKYRLDRSHEHFLTPLKEHAESHNVLFDRIKTGLTALEVDVKPLYTEPAPLMGKPHRKSTYLIEEEESLPKGV